MIELNFEPDSIEGTDWLELSCFLNYPDPIPKTVITDYLDKVYVQPENEDLKKTDLEEYKADIESATIFKQMRWRKTILPTYPFLIDEEEVRSKSGALDILEYSFPLLLSTHYFYPETMITNWSFIGDLFELFCTVSISKIFGDSVLIGNSLGGLPSDFDACLEEVCKKINEKKGPSNPLAEDFQDAGVDVIGWRTFDQRKGQIVALVQCASGKNWTKKGGDIVPKLWGQLVFWTVDPIKALAFPFAYDFDKTKKELKWTHYALDSGLLLDRLRLANCSFSDSSVDLDPIVKWVKSQIGLIASHKIE